MPELILTDVQANQILVWSDLDNGFINITPSKTILNIDDVTHEPLSPNTNFISSIAENVVRTKGIVGGDNVTITDNGSDIIIDVNIETLTDAQTLFGFPHQAFVKKNELNSLIDFSGVEDSLNFYPKEYSDRVFMRNNASNIPDDDNVYDLGSNGRRYADVYAKTFHGTATKSTLSNMLTRNGANDGEVLTWDNDSWVPKPLGSIELSTLVDVNINSLSDNQVLSYDSQTLTWNNINISDIISETGLQFNNTGYGENVYINTVNNIVRFRSIEANQGIISTSDDNSIHLELDTDFVENATDILLRNIDINVLENIFNIDESNDNTMLVWDEGMIVNRPIPAGGGDGSIDTSNAQPGQVLGFDGTNLVFVDQTNPLEDIDTSNAVNGDQLIFNDGEFILQTPSPNSDSLSEIDTVDANVGDVVTWNGSEYTLSDVDNTDALLEVDTSTAENGYYLAFNGTNYELRELPASGDTNTDLLAEVDTTLADDGDVLVWNGTNYILETMVSLSDVDTTTVSDGSILTYRNGDFVLENITFSDTLAEVDTTNAFNGYYLAFNGFDYELRELPTGTGGDTNTDLLAEVDTTTANDGDVLVWNGVSYQLSNIDTIYDIDTTGISDGALLTYRNGDFVLEEITITDTLSTVDTTNANDGYYLAYNGADYELRELPTGTGGDTNTDLLADVDTTTASDGDVLVWNGASYQLSNVNTLDDVDTTGIDNGTILTYRDGSFVLESLPPTSDTLSEIDTSNATDGFYLAFNGVDYELRELPASTDTNTDLLADVDTTSASSGDLLSWDGNAYTLISNIDNDTLGDVDTSAASNGDILIWNGSGYVLSENSVSLSLNDLTDVTITNPEANQVLIWDGSAFTLSSVSSGGVSNISELNDVDETVLPGDGDVLTYNSTKSQYEPLPIPVNTGSGGTVYEILKVNYTANGNYGSSEYITNNIEVTGVIDSDLTLLDVTFTGYTFPPMSIGYWGYVYDENLYRYIGITEGVSFMGTSGLGVSGSPTLFDPNRVDKEYTITVSARTSETQSSPSSDFPPKPTHAYVVFVMGG